MTHARHDKKDKKVNSSVGLKPCDIRENLWSSNNHRVMTLGTFGRNILTEKLCNFCGNRPFHELEWCQNFADLG